MRTKALFMAAAALAAGLVTSNAQVYSQNVVGYVSLPLTNGVLTLIAPALDLDGTGKNNTISTVFSTNGVTPGDVVYVFTGSGYDTISYALAGRGHATNGWYLGSTLTNNYPINPGEAVFYAPQANETNVQVGNVLLGTNVVNAYFPIAANQVNLVSSVIPLSGGVTTVLGYNPTPGDVIFQYTGAGYNTYSYAAAGRGHATTGWYLGSTLSEPQIPLGSGFWIQPGEATNWVQSFTAP